MRTRTVTSPSLPWFTTVLVVLGLLTGCGRPAPEGEAAVESAPDPAAENLAEPSSDADDPSLQSQPANSDQMAGDSDQMADGDQMAAGDQMGEQAANEPAEQQAAVPAPVIITVDNLSGLVDESPNRAGVRVTSSNPVVAVAPPVESTTSTVVTESRVHVVQPGDTLSVIAEMYGVGVTAVADANGLENVDAIKPGQELVIPAG
jgi:LysM repeat protein